MFVKFYKSKIKIIYINIENYKLTKNIFRNNIFIHKYNKIIYLYFVGLGWVWFDFFL